MIIEHGQEYLRPYQAAALMRVQTETLADWANKGKITAIRMPNGHRRYLTSEILALMESMPPRKPPYRYRPGLRRSL